MRYVLGVDAGGTKTTAVVADESGHIEGIGRGGCANFQECGRAGAASQIRSSIEMALDLAGLSASDIDAICYGISGADRQKDFETVREFIQPIVQCPTLRLENDTIIALRAGTEDGVGIALIAGTGSNAIGRNRRGEKHQVGGMGRLTGDYGSGGQLSEAAVVAAFKGSDGRGPETALSSRIPMQLGLESLEDIVELTFFDRLGPPLDLGRLAPLVFEVAAEGDPVALEILRSAGVQIAQSVGIILTKLFADEDGPVHVVFGGSVFQRGSCPALVDSVVARASEFRPGLNFVQLRSQPVLGAVGFALDDLGLASRASAIERLQAGLKDVSAEE